MRKQLNKKEIIVVLDRLLEIYPDAKAELDFTTPFELLIATILSAQCTDVQVNKTTSKLFVHYNTPEKIISLTVEELGAMIKSCGFYRTKSENIMNTCRKLVFEYNSIVPKTMEDLVTFPGVGRKTANVVLSNAFGIPGIAVDTHVFRVSNRIGIVNEKNVESTEFSLRKRFPMERWSKSHHLLIFHGRRICKARNPECEICPIKDMCLYYQKHKDL